MAKIHISLSKKSKAKSKNPRSAFLSAFMRELAKDPSVVDAFNGKDTSKFKGAILKLAQKLVEDMPNVDKAEK